jgi:hypothetical protein
MSDLYYGSAEEATRELGLPLLLASSPSAAVPHHGERLSDFAPEVFEGARLFSRLQIAPDAPSPAVWVTGPDGTTEYVVWAVGLAEHAARAGRIAFLIDLDAAHPLRSLAPGGGHPLPRPILERLRKAGVPAAAAWSSDLQGVRLVLPVSAVLERAGEPEPSRSILIFARAMPAAGAGPGIPPEIIDGVCLAAAIRDHSREELRESVEGLRRSGHTFLGFVAMGPLPAPRRSPLDRWERVATPQAVGPVVGPVVDTADRTANVAEPAAADAGAVPVPPAEEAPSRDPSADAVTPAPEPARAPVLESRPSRRAGEGGREHVLEPEAVKPVEPPIPLVADWHRANRARPRGWLLVLLALAIAAAALTFWMRSTGRTPSELIPRLRSMNAAPAPSNTPVLTGGREGGSPVETPPGGTGGGETSRAGRTPEVWEQLSPIQPRAVTDSIGPAPDSGEAQVGRPGALGPGIPVMEAATDTLSVSWPDTFVIHVSSFRRSKDAESEVARLRASGVEARIVTVILPERGRWHRIVVGAFRDSVAASREAGALRTGGLVSFTQTLGEGGRGAGRGPTPR